MVQGRDTGTQLALLKDTHMHTGYKSRWQQSQRVEPRVTVRRARQTGGDCFLSCVSVWVDEKVNKIK